MIADDVESVRRTLRDMLEAGKHKVVAESVNGIDTLEKFDSCITSGKHLEEIQNDLDDGRAYGITGTPGFFVGNEKIGFTKLIGAQPFSSFQRVIDGQLNR